MDNHPISTEPGSGPPALPSHPGLTRRGLLGGAGMAVGAVLASPGMPTIAPAAAQAVSAEPRPLDAAFRRRALEVRDACARAFDAIPIAPHPTNGDEARYPNKIGSDTRGLPHNKRGEVDQAAWQALFTACQSGDPADFEKIPIGGARRLVNPVGTRSASAGSTPHRSGSRRPRPLQARSAPARQSRCIGIAASASTRQLTSVSRTEKLRCCASVRFSFCISFSSHAFSSAASHVALAGRSVR